MLDTTDQSPVSDGMWAKYQKERIGAEIYQTNYGFVCYTDSPETNSIFIRDVYVLPEFRRTQKVTEGLTAIFKLARKLGRERVTGFVEGGSLTYEQSLKNQLNYGFKISATDGGNVYTYTNVEDFFARFKDGSTEG